MVEAYDPIVRNNVWDVVPRPKDKSVVSSHCLYKVNKVVAGSVEKRKAIILAHGFSQVEGLTMMRPFLLLRGDEKLIKHYKEGLSREFEMKDIELMHYFLGMEVWEGDGDLFVSQGKYANELLRRFHMERSKRMEIPLDGNWRKEDATLREVMDVTVYRHLVGSLMYLGRTQPNMCYEVNQLSHAMVRPTKLYWDTS
eukprot:PITA_12687